MVTNYNKKTLFEVFHIAEDDPQKYEKLCDEMSLRDDSFITDMWTTYIFDKHYEATRLLTCHVTIDRQFFEMLRREDSIGETARDIYESFKNKMSQFGAERVTEYDWCRMAKICMERDLREALSFRSVQSLVSCLGYINFEGSPEEGKWNAIRDTLREARDKFRKIYAECHNEDIAFLGAISQKLEDKVLDIEIEYEERDITEN